MNAATITSAGQVTIPQEIRQQLGIRAGSQVEFMVVADHVEMRVVAPPAKVVGSGFGLLKSSRTAVPTDLDVASLFRAGHDE
ncbi:AbrB/MazE/SpoVT family DNA-binding domain-containing protein [Thiohalocapsa sp. ML1]|jgi:AbrB family looped-hinge helix DNA binding protein|uniref:AbrB/MazE/SpoVT family DNA-binding domain-containing protein n=1 Tax=Thiohalocapsa sp. ML1 TaxID=1431688 RepID=UPI000731FA3A|nr:AbrB/MazE/SpoVT family DNA-binding domain-containing protein [Thiohalocapsa sp. ML1]